MLLANRSFNSLWNEMMDDPFFSTPMKSAGTSQIMKSDVHNKDGKYLIDMDLPGYNKDNIKLSLKDGYLTVNAEAHEEKEDKDDNGSCIRKERYTGSCNRSFYVGENITEEDVKAAFKDGVLHLELPEEKEKVEAQPKLITIE